MEVSEKKIYKNRAADERQAVLYKKFSKDTFLGNQKNLDHFMQWVTFFRKNLHRFVIDYLGIPLHLYQVFMMYLMGVNQLFVVIASRASAKSFIIALFACCQCILYPNSKVVMASGTKKQAKLLVTEKIQGELMHKSPVLAREISKITTNGAETVVYFYNGSTITVVTANDNSRGYRSTVLVREEFRQIKKTVEDGVLSPFQAIRQAPYKSDTYYADIPELQEENVDIYISSSWFDNGTNWMWKIVDQAYDEMLAGKKSCLLAFDESIAIKHKIKSMRYFQQEKKKQDRITWLTEFMNARVKENTSAFFTYSMLERNQRSKQPFYPRTVFDFKTNKRNPYAIPKQKGEIRIIACDMAFVHANRNDNSIFTCMRLLPESVKYNRGDKDIEVDSGYRRIVPYMESQQGGDDEQQAIRIRELFEDFQADYIVLDLRNAGIAIYNKLAKVMYDDVRGVEYPPLVCMNNDKIAEQIKSEGAEPCIFVISATEKLNSDIALDFRRVLESEKIDLLVSFEDASEEILPDIPEYTTSADADVQLFYEGPFLETQSLISEATSLTYERREQTGAIVVHEAASKHKDRYTSCSYGSYFATQLEKDLISHVDEYEVGVFIN